jgi:hypothetical protein
VWVPIAALLEVKTVITPTELIVTSLELKALVAESGVLLIEKVTAPHSPVVV